MASRRKACKANKKQGYWLKQFVSLWRFKALLQTQEKKPIFALPLESCPSGWRSTPGKCVYLKRVSRVRIPHSPPKDFNRTNVRFFIFRKKFFRLAWKGFFPENKSPTLGGDKILWTASPPKGSRSNPDCLKRNSHKKRYLRLKCAKNPLNRLPPRDHAVIPIAWKGFSR